MKIELGVVETIHGAACIKLSDTLVGLWSVKKDHTSYEKLGVDNFAASDKSRLR